VHVLSVPQSYKRQPSGIQQLDHNIGARYPSTVKRLFKWRYLIPTLIVGGPIIVAIFVVFTGGIVMLLWNWLLPHLFGFPEITLLQGFGLLVLGRILFGGFGGGGGGGHQSKHMTPEERERLRDRFCSTPRWDQETGVIDSSSGSPKNSA
jgi:hypothetical protein